MSEQQIPQTAQNFSKVCDVLNKYGNRPERLIPILREIQDIYRYLPEPVLTFVATSLQIPPARVYGVATFYSFFTLKPKGKYVIKVCDGTACHVKNSSGLIEAIRAHLQLTPEKPTTDDMLFTLETVSCLGACGLAPVVVINEDVHPQMTPEKITRVLDEIANREVQNARIAG
ncbi:MAG: NADH-quinone oxidoreductase subunit NuoE [Calditrichia bacterium]